MNVFKTIAFTTLFAASALAFAGHHGEENETKSADIVDIAVANGSFTTLVAALQATGLDNTLRGDGPFTVFAPTDEAFAKLPAGTVDNLLKNPQALSQILTYHVVGGKVTSAQVVKLSEAATVAGPSLPIQIDGQTVMIGDAKVIAVDVAASNGVIHVIDTVLLPPEA